jgi:hypothetical protein
MSTDDDLTDFVFDINANGTIVVRAETLASAHTFLRENLRDWQVGATLRGAGGVADLELLSLGALDDAGKYAGRDLVLQHIAGGAQALDMDLTDPDGIPHLCDLWSIGMASRDCEVAFVGSPGSCPFCRPVATP